ncbi:hypothetical protein AAC387_Pa06g0085 [Persea americana]
MEVYRHLLGDPGSIDHFRDAHKIPANVEVRLDGPDDGLAYRNGWMPFWLVSVGEGGVCFPLHPLVRDCLREWRLCPSQLLPNGYKIIMGVVRLNQILKIGLGVPDIEDTYDLCKSAEGDTYYLRLRVRRTGFVTALEDSNKELARRNRWRVNSAWHEKVRNYRGHNCRAAWSLLGYVPRYRSFNTSRKVLGIDSVLSGEGVSQGPATTAVPGSVAVTVAIPTGRPIESGDRAPAISIAEPVGTSGAEPWPSRRRRLVASSSEKEEEEEGMLRQRGRRYAAEDLSAAAFGDIGGEVRDPPQAVAATTPASAGGTPAPDAETVRTAATGAAWPDAAEVASALPPAVVVDDSPPEHAVGTGGRARSAEVAEGGRPEKRVRVEASPGPSSPPPAGGTILPPPLASWRPAIEEVLGRQLAETDRATDPQVIAALGRACALPQDMARWAGMDNKSLMLSSMRSLVSLLQRCQMGIERLDAAEAGEAEWVVEKDELRASLGSKDAMLAEEVARNAGLVFDSEESKVEVERLKDELADEKTQNLHLASELDDLRIAVKRLEDDLQSAKGDKQEAPLSAEPGARFPGDGAEGEGG